MKEKSDRFQPPFEPNVAWFRRDPVAFEVRAICGRIIATYNEYMAHEEDEAIGTLPGGSAKTKAQKELTLAFHELEEFDVTVSKLVGHPPAFYYENPRNMADYVAGQLLKLKNIPLVTDAERNTGALSMGVGDEFTVVATAEAPDVVQNMRIQVGFVDTATKFLGFEND